MTGLARRDFLKWSAAAAAAGLAAPRALRAAQEPAAGAAQAATRTLVVIFLRGGADALHMLVPHGDPDYAGGRATLGLSAADGLLPLDDEFALHPALAALQPAWDAKQLAPVICAGSPHPTRSHFDAQDWMEYGAPGDRTLREGWINRFLAASARPGASEFRALGMQDLLPRSLRGVYPVLAVPSNLDRRSGEKTLDRFDDFYGDGDDLMEGGADMQGQRTDDETGVVESGRMTIDTLRRFQQILGETPGEDTGSGRPGARDRQRARDAQATVAESPDAYPDSQFGRRMAVLSKVIRADTGLEIAGLDYGGWDDHTNAGGTEGRMAARMTDLARGLAAFSRELGPRMASTCVLVASEFGRNVRENGNNGTDHGHGGAMWLLGGGVRGGQVHGKWDGLGAKALYQGRDLPVTTDFRDVYLAALAGVHGFEAPKEFFPGHKAAKLRLF